MGRHFDTISDQKVEQTWITCMSIEASVHVSLFFAVWLCSIWPVIKYSRSCALTGNPGNCEQLLPALCRRDAEIPTRKQMKYLVTGQRYPRAVLLIEAAA